MSKGGQGCFQVAGLKNTHKDGVVKWVKHWTSDQGLVGISPICGSNLLPPLLGLWVLPHYLAFHMR